MAELTKLQEQILKYYSGELGLDTVIEVASIKGENIRIKQMTVKEWLILEKSKTRFYRAFQVGACPLKATE